MMAQKQIPKLLYRKGMTQIRHDKDDVKNYDIFCPIPYKPLQEANKSGMVYVGKTKVGQSRTMLRNLDK